MRCSAFVALALLSFGCGTSSEEATPSGTAGAPGTGGDIGTGGNGSVDAAADRSAAGGAATGGAAGTGGAVDAGVADRTSAEARAPRDASQYPGFYVEGAGLYDRCGERVVLRGVNKMAVYADPTGESFPEIAKSGANAVRFMYSYNPTVKVSELDDLIARAIASQLLPIPELHDATGDFSKMNAIEAYWTAPATVAIIQKYEKQLLVNIANEAGQTVADVDYTTTYTRIVQHMRQVGIHTPLVIDAAGYGRNGEQLLKLAPGLLAADPDHNLVFSWHEYDTNAAQPARVTTLFEQATALPVAFIVGEFASVGAGSCTPGVPYVHLMAEAQRLSIGYLPWSWDNFNGDCKPATGLSPFDMVSDGLSFSSLVAGWATEVVVSDPNSIQKTSKRPASFATGTCD
jgi:mannan endo-1,4-beta-mannosidase